MNKHDVLAKLDELLNCSTVWVADVFADQVIEGVLLAVFLTEEGEEDADYVVLNNIRASVSWRFPTKRDPRCSTGLEWVFSTKDRAKHAVIRKLEAQIEKVKAL